MNMENELDRIEQTVRDQRRGEADKGRLLRDWERCESQLQSIIRSKGEVPRALRLAAELAMKRRRWQEAMERWQRLISLGNSDADAMLQLAVACRETGNFEESARLLDRAKEQGLDAELYSQEQDQLKLRVSGARQRELGRRARRALLGETDEDAAALYWSILTERGAVAGEEYLAPLLAELGRLARGSIAPGDGLWVLRKSRRVARILVQALRQQRGSYITQFPPRVVFCCGFGFSGSGAVTDYLRGFDECEMTFGRGELSWFNGNERGGLTGVSQLLEYAGSRREKYRWLIVNFFLTTLLGVQGLVIFDEKSARTPARYTFTQRQAEKSILSFHFGDAAAIQGLAVLARDLLRQLLSATGSAAVEKLFQDFFREMIGSRLRSGQRCVFDNCIKAHELECLPLVPGAVAVVTRRDPRDQFVSRSYETIGESLSVRKFVQQFRNREFRYRMALLDPRVKVAVREVQFEEFILEPATRARLRDQLGLGHCREGHESELDKSRQNIGIYKQWPRSDEIAYIEKKLRKYLVAAN